jgi:hypothetical protein
MLSLLRLLLPLVRFFSSFLFPSYYFVIWKPFNAIFVSRTDTQQHKTHLVSAKSRKYIISNLVHINTQLQTHNYYYYYYYYYYHLFFSSTSTQPSISKKVKKKKKKKKRTKKKKYGGTPPQAL